MEQWARRHLAPLLDPLIELIARSGISPNALTALGAMLNAAAGALIALGYPLIGGLLMTLIAMPLDALDGGVARKLGKQSTFGALFDSTLDRLAEAAILAGVGAFFATRQETIFVLLAFAALSGSFLVSYTRARAEGLGLNCQVGLFSRFGRFLLLALGLLLHPVWSHSIHVMVIALAALSFFTTLERVLHVRQLTNDGRAGRGIGDEGL